MSDERLTKVGGKLVHRGPIASVRMETFQYADGSRATRQVVVHPGAVCVIPHDGRVLYMVEQPREAVEEIGKSAGDWRELKRFYTSPGFANERVWLFLATELYDVPSQPSPEERIEVVEFPLDDLDEAIERCEDAKSLIGLLMLKELV